MNIIAAVLWANTKRRWMLYALSPDGLKQKYDVRKKTRTLLDSEPQSMVQSFEIAGKEEVGVFLPERGEFYAFLS